MIFFIAVGNYTVWMSGCGGSMYSRPTGRKYGGSMSSTGI